MIYHTKVQVNKELYIMGKVIDYYDYILRKLWWKWVFKFPFIVYRKLEIEDCANYLGVVNIKKGEDYNWITKWEGEISDSEKVEIMNALVKHPYSVDFDIYNPFL